MTRRKDKDMLIGAALDEGRVLALQAVVVDAVDQWSLAQPSRITAEEACEALLCNLCAIMQDAPNEMVRATLANNALEFIMRNGGASPAVLAAVRAMQVRPMLDGLEPAGSA